jgi:hypothetical protein
VCRPVHSDDDVSHDLTVPLATRAAVGPNDPRHTRLGAAATNP